MKRTQSAGFAVLLAFVAALGPFCIDAYLPAFLAIGREFSATPLQVQQSLTAYLLPFSFMALWHGSFSDAWGRRRVILWSLALFGLASFGCAVSMRIEQLWLMRAIQGVTAGSGIIVGRAIVRDIFHGPEAQRLMSRVAMTFALAPAFAPFIGGWLLTWSSWRAIFVMIGLMAAMAWLACWYRLPETLPPEKRQSLHPFELLKAYGEVLRRIPFLAVGMAIAFNFAGFFIYILSAPVFLMTHLRLTERDFHWLYVPTMFAIMAGSWLSSHLAGKWSLRRIVMAGYVLMAFGAGMNLAVNLLTLTGLAWYVAFIAVYALGMAMTIPNLTVLALDLFPLRRGLAASCQVLMQSGVSSLMSSTIAPLFWGASWHLSVAMLILLFSGLLCAGVYKVARR